MSKFEFDPFRVADSLPKEDAPAAPAFVEPVVEDNSVPSGSTKEVLAWVGNDLDKAKRALAVELEKTPPKKGLVDGLNKLLKK